jgi:sialic acid synthase SpsE
MKSIELNTGKVIGEGAPCYIIAEIGINHNGSIDIAKKLIDEAVNARVDAVKFQKELQKYVCRATNGKSCVIHRGDVCHISTISAKLNLAQ